MSPLEQSSEQLQTGASSQLDAIIALSPELGVQINRYNKQVSQLSSEQQRDLMERWKVEVQSGNTNISVFGTILGNIRREGRNTEIFIDKTKSIAAETKSIAAETKDKENKIRYDAAIAASQTANEIGSRIGGKYTSEIQQKSNEDLQKPETQEYLTTLGIEDIHNIPSEKKQIVQDILTARATTQVLLDNQKQILADNPEFGKDIQNLSSLRFTLGLSDKTNAKNVENLLTDQPRSDRVAITSAVNSLTKGSPDTLITRTGDRLTFSDPTNERYQYEIDMDKQPLKLAKTRNGLSISREITPTIIDPARERNDTKRNIVAQIVPMISRDTRELLSGKMGDGSDITSPEVGGMLDNTLSHISLRSPQSAKLSRTMIETTGGVLRMEQARLGRVIQDKTTSNPLDPDIGAIKGTLVRMTAIMESLQKIQEKTTIEEESPQNNTLLWDKNARDNLSWLTDRYFDRIGPSAQESIDRIIALVNRDRTPSNQIQLGEPLSPMSKDILERALAKLGGTPDVLTSGDRLPRFQSDITTALTYPPSHTASIEGLLQKT